MLTRRDEKNCFPFLRCFMQTQSRYGYVRVAFSGCVCVCVCTSAVVYVFIIMLCYFATVVAGDGNKIKILKKKPNDIRWLRFPDTSLASGVLCNYIYTLAPQKMCIANRARARHKSTDVRIYRDNSYKCRIDCRWVIRTKWLRVIQVDFHPSPKHHNVLCVDKSI